MKEVKIELNKFARLKNKHNLLVKIGQKSNGFYIITETSKHGPFEKLFMHLDKNKNEMIIGYNPLKTEYYKISEKGLILEDQIKISIEELTKIKPNEVKFDGCILIANVNGHAILFDDNNGVYLAVNTLEEIKPYEKYPKFDSYKELCTYYCERSTNLYDQFVTTLANKHRTLLINFNKLHSFVNSLQVSDLDDELIFDIIKDRKIEKKLFTKNQDKFIVTGKTSKMTNEYLNNGYQEIKNFTYQTLAKNFPVEMSGFSLLLDKKISELKEQCIMTAKEEKSIDIDLLIKCFNEVSIKEISHDIQKEISAGRPLTKYIFLEILTAAFNKMRKEGNTITVQFQNIAAFQTLYPQAYDKLWEIGLVKLNKLYDEFYLEKSKKINKKQ